MLSKGATILVVDDDPAVVHITTLAMKSYKIDGQPIRIRSATSRAEAEHLLWGELRTKQGLSSVPVVLIGLALEGEDGGLDLCKYIRKGLDNRETRLFIRNDANNGAPHRDVFTQYEISGYYTTGDITEDRLYSLVRTGVRHFRTMAILRVLMALMDTLITARTRSGMAEALNNFIAAMVTDTNGAAQDFTDPHVGFLFDRQVVAHHPLLQPKEALSRVKTLCDLQVKPLNNTGDKYASDGDYFVVHVEADALHAEFDYLCPGGGEMSDTFARDFHKFARAAAALWKNAGE
jgi:CheY-like chemotaxis protein